MRIYRLWRCDFRGWRSKRDAKEMWSYRFMHSPKREPRRTRRHARKSFAYAIIATVYLPATMLACIKMFCCFWLRAYKYLLSRRYAFWWWGETSSGRWAWSLIRQDFDDLMYDISKIAASAATFPLQLCHAQEPHFLSHNLYNFDCNFASQ